MDNFEKYIKENRASFDDQKSNKKAGWEAIQKRLAQESEEKEAPKVIPLFPQWLKIAAAVIMIFGAGLIATQLNTDNPNISDQMAQDNSELNEIGSHYKQLVGHKIEEIEKSGQLSSTEKEDFLSFIDELDQDLELLNKELQKNLNNEVIIEAIIDNYRERLRMLEMLLDRVENSKNNKNENNITL